MKFLKLKVGPFWILSSILCVLFFQSCDRSVATPRCPEWTLVYENDSEGYSLQGTKDDLISAAKEGYPIRLGFGGLDKIESERYVLHYADASFITVANGNEVFAQIEPIIGQFPKLDSDTLSIEFREKRTWSAIFGTNGSSDRMMIDEETKEVLNHRLRATRCQWFVFM